MTRGTLMPAEQGCGNFIRLILKGPPVMSGRSIPTGAASYR
ncbi:hypothetical protein [Streptomyces sp. NPDC048665]